MKHKFFGILSATISLLVVAGCSIEEVEKGTMFAGSEHAQDRVWSSAFESGKKSLASGYLGLALQQFKKALAQDPHSAPVLNAMAVTYDRLGRHDIAELYFDRALAIAPHYSVALNNVGYSMLTRGRYEEALIYFEQAIKKESLARARQLIEANMQNAMDKLRLARQRGGSALVATVSLESGIAREKVDCPGESRHMVGRTGERVFTIVTQPTDAARPLVGATSGGGRNCRNEERPRIAMVRTLGAPNLARSSRVHSLSTTTSPVAAADSIAEARAEDDLPDAPVAAGAVPATPEKIQPAAATSALTVEVSNGAGRNKLAARMRHYLEEKGLPVSFLTNAASFDNERTIIFYKPGQRQAAKRFADALPIVVELVQSDGNYADIRIRLGADILDFDKRVLYAATKGEPNV